MSVYAQGDDIVLEGDCRADEADALVALLEAHPDAKIVLDKADTIHTALWQILLMLAPPLSGTPRDAFAAARVLPAIVFNRTQNTKPSSGGTLDA